MAKYYINGTNKILKIPLNSLKVPRAMSSFWYSLQEMLSCLLLGKSYHHLQSENGSNESTQRSNTTFHFNFFNSLRSYNGVALGSAQRV